MSGTIKTGDKKTLIWNYLSLAVMALSGLLFNLLIQSFYDAAILGVFNLAYSYYIVLSQISTFGIHMAVLKSVSDNRNDRKKSKEILTSALIVVIIIGIIVSVFSELFLYAIPFEESRRMAIAYIIPALLFFSINKVLLNYLNACIEMVGYAIFQALRSFLICLGIVCLGFAKVAGEYLTLAFVIAEIILMVFLLSFILHKYGSLGKPSTIIAKQIVSFGARILPSNIVLELNTKVDLLCLGWLITNNALIGVYSFVSVFAEGFYQIYLVIRRIINPFLSELQTDELRSDNLYNKVKKLCLFSAVPLVLLFLLVYYVIIHFYDKNLFMQGMIPLLIIIGSIAFNGLFIIYGNVMSLLGKPLKESIANMVTVSVNFILNIVMIHFAGIIGAALATAISYCCYSVFVYSFMRKKQLEY